MKSWVNLMNRYFIIDGLGGGGAEIVFVSLLNQMFRDDESCGLVLSLRCQKEAFKTVKPTFPVQFLSRWRLVSFIKIFSIFFKNNTSVVVSSMKWANFINLILSRFFNYKCIIWVHNTNEGFLHGLYKFLANEKVVVVGASTAITQARLKQMPQMICISNFFEIYKANPSTRPKNETQKRFVYVASFTEQKNHKFILNVWKNLLEHFPTSELYLYGDGPNFQKMHELVSHEHYAKTIKFMGYDPLIRDKLADFDYMLHFPSWEGFGMVLLEAAAVGLPYLSFNFEGPSEIVEKFGGGKLCSPNLSNSEVVKFIVDTIKKNDFEYFDVERRIQISNEQVVCEWKKLLS